MTVFRRLAFLRFAITNLLFFIFLAALLAGNWWPLLLAPASLLIGSIGDETVGDQQPGGDGASLFHDFNLFLTLPLIVAVTFVFLQYLAPEPAGWFVSVLLAIGVDFAAQRETLPFLSLVAAGLGVGYFYALTTFTVGHELIHRHREWLPHAVGLFLLAFTFNTTFAISHLVIHHRYAATRKDSSTARRGEYVLAFALRAELSDRIKAFAFEVRRLRQRGLFPWSWRNRALLGQTYSLAIVLAVFLIGGSQGLAAWLLIVIAAIMFYQCVNYTMHYGLVRVEGEPMRARHSWDCARLLSNSLFYNLPRHADHHLSAETPFWALRNRDDAPCLPFGYKTCALLALIRPLWIRAMAPHLRDWDRRMANDGERELLDALGWTGRANT